MCIWCPVHFVPHFLFRWYIDVSVVGGDERFIVACIFVWPETWFLFVGATAVRIAVALLYEGS